MAATKRTESTRHNTVYFLIIGLVAGWLAGKAMKSRAGLLGDLVIGVLGAFLGGFLFRFLGIHAGGLIGSLITAFVGRSY